MSAGVIDPIEQALAADAPVYDVMNLVDQAIESATATGDRVSLDLLATFFDGIASERGRQWSWLAIAAARARTLAEQAATTDPAAAATSPADAPGETEPPPPPAAVAEKPQYAGWWLRTAAFFLDLFVLGVLDTMVGGAPGGGDGLLGFMLAGLPVAYFAGLHAFNRGATVGKAVLGIAVRRTDGTPADLGRTVWRCVATSLLWITGIGGLVDMAVGAGDGRRQWLHDKMADTIVVHKHWRAVDPPAILAASPDVQGLPRFEPDPAVNPDSKSVTPQ